MCKYCDATKGESPSKALFDKEVNLGILGKDSFSVYLYDNGILCFGLGVSDMRMKIRYCPMCGRKLEVKE